MRFLVRIGEIDLESGVGKQETGVRNQETGNWSQNQESGNYY